MNSKEISLVPYTDPILHEPITEFIGDAKSLRPMAFEMFNLMKAQAGVGLACPQIGERINMFVMKHDKNWAFRDAFVCINPKVIQMSDKKIKAGEGCLSYPNQYCEVERSLGCIVKYTDLAGNEQTKFLFGSLARTFQHECDHLNGITMHDVKTAPKPNYMISKENSNETDSSEQK